MHESLCLGFLVLLLLSVAGGGTYAQSPPGSAPPSEDVGQPARPGFEEWLVELRAEAIDRGFSAPLVERALGEVGALPVVIERDRAQVERTIPIERYLARRVTPAVVRTARRLARQHRPILKRVEAHYGVPARIIVAVWGLESNFGRFSGVRPALSVLATLAYDERRARFFRSQIFDALTILAHGHIELERLTGSWAGAMGQPQFLPSTYLTFAVDFDQDGRRDIWDSPADIFASVANYLRENGWSPDVIWGREVRLTPAASARIAAATERRDTGCEAERQMTKPLPLARWRALGVTRRDGRPLPHALIDGSLVKTETRAFLVYRNYEALVAYNCAHAYALSVGSLADRIGDI